MKSTLFTQSDFSEPIQVNLDLGELVVFSKTSPTKMTANEDSCAVYIVDEQTYIFAVADGMGGLPQGREASAIVVQSLEQSLKTTEQNESCREAILSGLEKANRDILDSGLGSGSTVAIAEIDGDSVRCYHIGDSKILIIGQRGKLKLQTISHSPTEYAVESGYLDPDDALDHQDRHYVTNMIGSDEMRIELGIAQKLSRYDTLLIASDGLLDNVQLGEIIEITRKGSLYNAMQQLILICKERMSGKSQPSSPDDLTILLYRQKPTW